MNNKLELFWIGKDKPFSIENRMLIENKNLSHKYKNNGLFDDGINDNILIHGDNLLALKALRNSFVNKIKCVYIDPPYNTGAAFEHYDDNVEHSTWLNLMYNYNLNIINPPVYDEEEE